MPRQSRSVTNAHLLAKLISMDRKLDSMDRTLDDVKTKQEEMNTVKGFVIVRILFISKKEI
jgi:hypothetical protein